MPWFWPIIPYYNDFCVACIILFSPVLLLKEEYINQFMTAHLVQQYCWPLLVVHLVSSWRKVAQVEPLAWFVSRWELWSDNVLISWPQLIAKLCQEQELCSHCDSCCPRAFILQMSPCNGHITGLPSIMIYLSEGKKGRMSGEYGCLGITFFAF